MTSHIRNSRTILAVLVFNAITRLSSFDLNHRTAVLFMAIPNAASTILETVKKHRNKANAFDNDIMQIEITFFSISTMTDWV